MTHLDQMIADALEQSPDTVVHQLASEIERLRSEIADLKRGGVVSARDLDGLWQIVEREREWRLQDSECGGDEIRESVGRLRREWDEATSSLRTIPADRVLGEGDVKVSAKAIEQASKTLDSLVVTSWARGDHEEKMVTELCAAFRPIACAATCAQPTQESTP